ncbi:MAG: glycosyltransferase [Planctomycetes bacterium]|nr:glycosyltransferase [Planctomycetota bacterium]
MKRLVISPHDPSEFQGGTERVVYAMLRARVRRGEEVAVITGSERVIDGGASESRGEPGLAVHTIIREPRETAEMFNRPRPRAEFERIFDAIRPEIVEWHHGATLSFDLVRAACDRGAKTVMFLHDMWVSCPRHFRIPPAGIACPIGTDRNNCVPCAQIDLAWPEPEVKHWIYLYTEAARAELCAADVIIAPSRAHADTMQHYFSDLPLNIQVVPHGLLDYDLPPAPRRRGPVEPGTLTIAHFGNLVAEKGVQDLGRALGMFRHPDRVRLEIYGSELQPGVVDELRSLCPAARVQFHGPYEGFRNIYDKIVNCDVAAFPSRAPESYGLVVDEALAAGLPVFASNRGALGERVGKAGEVLPAGDAAAWARALERALLDTTYLESLRDAVPARQRTIDDAVAEIDAVVEELTSRG